MSAVQETAPVRVPAAAEAKSTTFLSRKAWALHALSGQTLQGVWLGVVCAELGALGVLVGQLICIMVRS
jgi:hypothetical protein